MEMLIIDGVKYKLWTPEYEDKEFHPIIKEHIKEIFGQDAFYFDRSVQLRSLAGLGAKPEGFVIDPIKNEWCLVEVELSKHNPYSHIAHQLQRFISGLDNLETRNMIFDALYDEINKNRVLKTILEEKVGDIPRWLKKLISTTPKIVVIIEEKTTEVNEACKFLTKNFETYIIEFKTYVREDAPSVQAHLFEPLYAMEKVSEKVRKEKEGKRPLPEHYESWEKMIEWISDNVRDVIGTLTDHIIKLGDVTHTSRGRCYCFYKGKPSTKSIFAAFLLTKKALKVRIRTDPATFKDPQKWTGDKIYKGWFFKQGQEREFKISDKGQIAYAMELIKQSYEITGEKYLPVNGGLSKNSFFH